jgi:hypothetical protein
MAATNEKMKKKRIVRGLAMAFGVLGGGGIYKRREPSKQTSTAEEQSCALACKAEGGDVVLAAPSASGQLYEDRMDNSIRLGVRSRLLVGGALFFFCCFACGTTGSSSPTVAKASQGKKVL